MVKDVFRDADLVLCLDTARLGAADDRARRARRASSPSHRAARLRLDRHRLRRPRALELGDGLPAPEARAPAHPRRHDARDAAADRAAARRRSPTDAELATSIEERRAGRRDATRRRGAKWARAGERGLGREPDHPAAAGATRCGKRSRTRTGCSPRARSRTGRASSGTSTSPIAIPGKSLGTATQIGISLGVALAHRDAGRLVVDLQPDGDLMFDAGALWVAAKHKIPMLVVMYNNRAYYNDWEHQIRMAQLARHADRARPHRHGHRRARRRISRGSRRSMGWYAEGPIEQAARTSRRRSSAPSRASRPASRRCWTRSRRSDETPRGAR